MTIDGWRRVMLGDVCSFKYGQMPNKSELVRDGYPVFSGYGIVGASTKFHYENPEIIVVARGVGGTGDVKMSPPKCFLTNLSIAILPHCDEVDKLFLYHRLAGPGLWELRTGSAQAQITIERLKTYEVNLPPPPVQRRIASILGAYDDLIEVNRRRIAVLEEYARRLFEEWFVYFRFPGNDATAGTVPVGWRTTELGQVLRLAYGKALVSGDRVVGSVPVIGSSGIVGWHNEALVPRPGIVVGRKGNVGSITWSPGPFYPIDTVFYVDSEYPPRYLLHLLRRLPFRNSDAAVPGLNRSSALMLKVDLPPRCLCSEYERIASPLLDLVDLLHVSNEKLAEGRDLLLPRLMSGELSVVAAERAIEDAA